MSYIVVFEKHLYLNPQHSFDSSSFTSFTIFLQERIQSHHIPSSSILKSTTSFSSSSFTSFTVFLQERNSKEERSDMFPFSCLVLLIHILRNIAQFIFLQERNWNLFLCFLHRLSEKHFDSEPTTSSCIHFHSQSTTSFILTFLLISNQKERAKRDVSVFFAS